MSTVPAVQMAAFLNEMKSVRLRKVASKPELRDGIQGTSNSLSNPIPRPRQRQAFSQDSVSSQSVGSSFAASDLSHKSQRPELSHWEGRRTDTSKTIPQPMFDTLRVGERRPFQSSASGAETAASSSRPPNASRLRGTHPTVQREYTPDRLFPSRPSGSGPLPTLSPNRPRPPNRRHHPPVGHSYGEEPLANESSDDEDPLALLAPHKLGKKAPPISEVQQTRQRNQTPTRPRLDENEGYSLAASTASDIPSLEHELKRMIRAQVEREFEQELKELSSSSRAVLTGRGSREQDGYLAGGGGGGPAIWIEDARKPSQSQQYGDPVLKRRGRDM